MCNRGDLPTLCVVEKPLNFDPFGQVKFAPLALM